MKTETFLALQTAETAPGTFTRSLVERRLDEIRLIEPPEAMRAQVARMIVAADAATAALRQLLAAAEAEDVPRMGDALTEFFAAREAARTGSGTVGKRSATSGASRVARASSPARASASTRSTLGEAQALSWGARRGLAPQGRALAKQGAAFPVDEILHPSDAVLTVVGEDIHAVGPDIGLGGPGDHGGATVDHQFPGHRSLPGAQVYEIQAGSLAGEVKRRPCLVPEADRACEQNTSPCVGHCDLAGSCCISGQRKGERALRRERQRSPVRQVRWRERSRFPPVFLRC